MKANDESLLQWFGERFAVAIVSMMFAALTLLLYPLALSLFASSHGGGGGPGVFDFFAVYYRVLFSRVGILVILGAGLSGFVLGPERMATVFGFLWGTDPWWSRANAKLEARLAWLQDSYSVPTWVTFVIFGVLLVALLYALRSS